MATPFITSVQADKKIQDSYSALEQQIDIANTGSDLGLLKLTDTPPPTGKHRGDVQTAGTYTNFGGIVFTQLELDNNYGYIYVEEGVSSKVLSEKINGKSAYQIAVDNGFLGTEEEWLISLKSSADLEGIVKGEFTITQIGEVLPQVFNSDYSQGYISYYKSSLIEGNKNIDSLRLQVKTAGTIDIVLISLENVVLHSEEKNATIGVNVFSFGDISLIPKPYYVGCKIKTAMVETNFPGDGDITNNVWISPSNVVTAIEYKFPYNVTVKEYVNDGLVGKVANNELSINKFDDDLSLLNEYLFIKSKHPDKVFEGYLDYIDVNHYFEIDHWFDGNERKLENIVIDSGGIGVVEIALFTITGTTSTLFSTKNINVVEGLNNFTQNQITNLIPVKGVKYFVTVANVSGNGVRYKEGNSSNGRAIFKASNTVVNTTSFAISYYLETESPVLENQANYSLKKELENKDLVFIPAGIHYFNEKLILRSGQKLYGIPGKSILEFDTTVLTDCIEIKNVENISFEDFSIRGKDGNTLMVGYDVGSTILTSFDNAISQANKGTHNGIAINNSKALYFKNIEISNFNGSGIVLENFGNINIRTSKFTDVLVHDCYAGLEFKNQGEYNTINGLHSNHNQIGVIVDGGNNSFTGCNVSWNRVNWLFLGGVNNAHGSVVGGCSNHASLASFIFNDVSAGEVISGVNIWYGDIYVKNSKGINFNGCTISNSSVYADGNFPTGGAWAISNSMVRSLTINENYNGNTSDLKLKNNWSMDGTDSSIYNN